MKQNVISIGRSKENDIVLDDKTVSRQHAQLIVQEANKFELIDINSTNGIFVNNKKVNGRTTVQRNDNIQFGAVHFDWILVDPFIEKPSPILDRKIKSNKLNNSLPIILIVGISIFFYWFITKENTPSPDNGSNTETNKTQEPVSDSIQKQKEEVQINQENPPPGEVIEPPDTVKNQPKYTPKKEELKYSISCLRSKSSSNAMIGLGADIEDGWITFSSDEVGVSEEIKVGAALKKDVEREYAFSSSPKYKKRTDKIFNQLIAVLEDPRMEYKYYIIKSSEINAFTAGGLIFITTEIIDFTKNDDELACIIGHEIYHNELGHINKLIRKEKAVQNWFGEYADWTLIASNIAGASFNQENEAYCDMYGVDLAIKAGYNGQAASEFWSRMKSSSNQVEKIFSTHPFSEERMSCIEEHIEFNYYIYN